MYSPGHVKRFRWALDILGSALLESFPGYNSLYIFSTNKPPPLIVYCCRHHTRLTSREGVCVGDAEANAYPGKKDFRSMLESLLHLGILEYR